jgi:tetratricopeptide (TPR) repeat protein
METMRRILPISLVLLMTMVLMTIALATASAADTTDSLNTLLRKGGKGLADKMYDKAILNYEAALQLDETNYEAIKNLGVAYSAVGNRTQALRFFEQALKLNPLDPENLNNLGAHYSEEGDYQKSIDFFHKALEIDSLDPVTLTNLGQEYARIGRVGKALPLLRLADSINPRNAATLYVIGNCYAEMNVYDSAEVYYLNTVRHGGTGGQLHYFLGVVQERMGKPEAAEESFRKALEYQPDYRDCLQALGVMYLTSDRFALAAEQFGRAVAVDSSFWAGWIGLGAAQALDGMNAAADSVLERLFTADSAMGFQMLDLVRRHHPRVKERDKSGN